MATPAKRDEIVEIAEPAAPSGICCGSCPHFAAPTTRRQDIQRVGGVWKGDCRLQPAAVKKAPEEVCGQHPAHAAKLLHDAFAPLVDRFAAALKSDQAQAAKLLPVGPPPALEHGAAALGKGARP